MNKLKIITTTTLSLADILFLSQPVPMEVPGISHEEFTYSGDDLAFTADITSAKRFICGLGLTCEVQIVQLDRQFVRHIAKQIDTTTIRPYKPQTRDDCPGIGFLFGNRFVLVDGNHRAVRRAIAGLTHMGVVFLTPLQAQHFIVSRRRVA